MLPPGTPQGVPTLHAWLASITQAIRTQHNINTCAEIDAFITYATTITDTHAQTPTYWKLPKDTRWLRNTDSPYEIGGHSTNLIEIERGITAALNEYFNHQIPTPITTQLADLSLILTLAQASITMMIESISQHIHAQL